jgi:hypothetical protein
MKVPALSNAAWLLLLIHGSDAKLADRSRVVQRRLETGQITRFSDNGRAIEGPSYRSSFYEEIEPSVQRSNIKQAAVPKAAPWTTLQQDERDGNDQRRLSSQLSGCCYDYQSYSASDLCYIYGNDCESGETPSHDSGDDGCSQDGLSFIGISFSVNTASGNPYSYQLCDQFPMENIIDRDYKYVMSMDEDGWLVGGGYKTFDYSGKIPYVRHA